MVCPACGAELPSTCPNCGAEVQPGWKVCPECTRPLGQPTEAAAGARIMLENAVAKTVSQDAAGPGGASIEAADSVVGRIEQKADAGAGLEALRGAVKVEVKDGVVKEIRQEVHVHLGGAQAFDALFGGRGARGLKARLVYAACGREIRAYNPASEFHETRPVNTYSLPGEMGSARSVRLAKEGQRLWVLAGARCGVVAFRSESGDARVYPFPTATRLGANAATIHGGYVYATHSNLGLLRWPAEGGDAVELFPGIFGPAEFVRAAQANQQGQLILCAAASVYRIDTSDPDARPARYDAPGAEPLVGVVECGPVLFAASQDGQIFRWHAAIPGTPDHRLAGKGPKTYSLTLAQFPDGPRLVVGAKQGFLRTIKLDGQEATVDYRTSGGVAIRWARAAADLAVASDAGRTRLFFWRTDEVHRPTLAVPVARSSRERIMDIAVLSQ